MTWAAELRRVHARLRQALDAARATIDADDPGDGDAAAVGDLLLVCHGFCAALDAHHRGEDRTLFPGIEAARPDLAPVLRSLERDHALVADLVTELSAALDARAAPETLGRHLDGLAAIMENHFRYEERQLLVVLEGLSLDARATDALGPL
ncbi:hypothetical protein GCM10028814_26580 [Angustibacter aerolatus]